MKKNRTNAFDWTLIQWARACDEAKLVDASKIDRELELERDEQGRLIDPESRFSERARRILDSIGLSYRRQYDRALAIKVFSCFLVVALGALVFPMARVQRLLGDDVNLAGPFFFFVVGQIFFLSASLLLSFILAAQAFARRLFGGTRPETFGEKLVKSLSNVVGEVVLFVLRKQISFARYLQKERPIESFFSRRRAPKGIDPQTDAREDSIELKGRALFWDVLFSRPRFLFFWGGTLSQLFWTSCSLCVLIILGIRMQSERYDYRWETSLESRRTVTSVVNALQPSVAWLGIEPLTQSDVESLFEETVPSKYAKQEATQKESERARWSCFLLGVAFVWCVLPRAALCAVHYAFYRFALRDFRPKPDDPYFKKIRENFELRSSRTESQYVRDEEESLERSPEPSRALTVYEEIVARSASPSTKLVKNAAAEKEIVVPSLSPETRAEENPQSTSEEPSVETMKIQPSAPAEPRKIEVDSPSPTEGKTRAVANDSQPKREPKEENADESKKTPEPQVVASPTATEIPQFRARRADAALALGYDASLRDEQWRDLLPTRSDVFLFGDVADEPSTKKRLRALLQERGSSVALCAFITDVSLPPARHLTRFLRDVLITGASQARFVVVLSGGERLRRKFDANANAVSERLADWKNALETLARESGADITPTFFYDADLDLPEQRARLRDLLRGRATRSESTPDDSKRTAAAETIYQECLAIFESTDYAPSEDESRLRVSNLCARIFEIYRAEVERASSCGTRRLESIGAGDSIFSRLSAVASKFGNETLVRGETALSEAITTASLEKGLDLRNIEKSLTFACGLSVRARELCEKLSPKCAIALGSVGLAAPVVVALAPVLGGTLSLSALATSVAALGSALPSTLVGGALGGAIGALTPLSLSACKKKLLEKFVGTKVQKEPSVSGVPTAPGGDVELKIYESEKIADVGTLLCAAASWFVVLDLQRVSEEKIVESAPLILEPIESSTFESPKEARKALDAVVENLQNTERL